MWTVATAPAESLYTTSIPTATEAGTYTVWYKVIGDANHSDSEAASLSVTIRKVAVKVKVPVARTVTYDGNPHKLVNVGIAIGGEMQYSLDGENYGTTVPKGTDIGSYTVYYKVVGDENHKDRKARTLTAQIIAGYAVTVEGVTGGTVTAKPVSAVSGKTIKLTVTPRFGYELESLRVKQGETDVSVTDNSFVMPEGDVTVTAAFRALPTLTLPAGLTEIGEEAFAGVPPVCRPSLTMPFPAART